MHSGCILFLAANPRSTAQLALDEEIRAIQRSLRNAGAGEHIELHSEWALRGEELPGALMRHRPRVVHFSGHGNSTGELLFVNNEPQDTNPVTAETLQAIFEVLAKDICCVVLNACYSAQQAQALTAVLPCVVGMSRAVTDTAASSFAAGFYEALAFGRSVQDAFLLGSARIRLAQQSDQADNPQMLVGSGVDARKLHLLSDQPAKRKQLPWSAWVGIAAAMLGTVTLGGLGLREFLGDDAARWVASDKKVATPNLAKKPPDLAEKPPDLAEKPPDLAEKPPDLAEKPPDLAQRPPKVKWHIETTPQGAEILDGKQSLGSTPWEREREARPGMLTIRIRSNGYREETLQLKQDEDYEQSISLRPKKPTIRKTSEGKSQSWHRNE